MPLFTVVIPLYNRENTIKDAILSILNQTFADFEIIVVNDASSDNSLKIVESIIDSRIRIISNEKNLERCNSRNLGIGNAKGEYICFLDSDDYHLNNHLSVFYDQIVKDNYPIKFYFTNSWNKDFSGLISERVCPNYEDFNPYHYFLTFTVNPQRWCVHNSIFQSVQFDEKVIICEDMDTSLRILANNFDVFHIKERTTVYVATIDSFTHGDLKKAEKELFYLKRIFSKKELKDKLPKKSKKRLLSMCYYFLAKQFFENNDRKSTIYYSAKSFFTFPKSYNNNTNKTLLIMTIYSIPLFGWGIKNCVKLFKN